MARMSSGSRPLFQEGSDPFLEIVAGEQRQQLKIDVLDVGIEGFVHAHAHHALGRAHGHGRVGGDLARHGQGGIGHLVGRHDGVHQPFGQALIGRQRAAGKDDLGSLGPAEHARQEPGATAFGQDAALHESRRQLCIGGHDADIAAQREVHAVPRSRSVERADHRLVHREQHGWRRVPKIESGGRLARSAADPLSARRLVEIEPGAEGPARTGKDHDAHVVILARTDQGLRQFVQHRG